MKLTAKRELDRKRRLAREVKRSYVAECGSTGTPEEMAQHGRDEEIVDVKSASEIKHYYRSPIMLRPKMISDLEDRGYGVSESVREKREAEEISDDRADELNELTCVLGATLFLHSEEPRMAAVWPVRVIDHEDNTCVPEGESRLEYRWEEVPLSEQSAS